VIAADAGLMDDTVTVAANFRDRLLVEAVSGGLPSVGRDVGAGLAATKFLLFLDADIELLEPTLLRRALLRMRRKICIWQRRTLRAGMAVYPTVCCMQGAILCCELDHS
jgi:hypothetical protein